MHLFPHQEVRAEIYYLFLWLKTLPCGCFIGLHFSLVLDALSVPNTSVVFSGIQKLEQTEIAVPDYSVLIFWYS